MPINDAIRFNQRTEHAASLARSGLAASAAMLDALRSRDLLSAEEAAIVAQAAVDAAGTAAAGVAHIMAAHLPARLSGD